MAKQLDNVRHDYVRYANCWEDADILLEALQIREGERVLSIGSAGDNSFSLLTQNPGLVVAVDINPVQLQLIELKKAAISAFDRETFLEFMGFAPSTQRNELYRSIQEKLSTETVAYWSANIDLIEQGLIHAGKFERYFRLFHEKVLPWVHSKSNVAELLREKPADAQKQFFEQRWNSWRWRLLFRLFFSKTVMGRFGRDPAFLKQVKVNVAESLLNRAAAHLSDPHFYQNPFLRYIFTGQFGDCLPHYVRSENYERIRCNIHRLEVFKGLAEETLPVYGQFNAFNLSNIFEYMPQEVFQHVSNQLAKQALSGARLAYWNLLVPRLLSEVNPNFQYHESISKSLSAKDFGFFYQQIVLDTHG